MIGNKEAQNLEGHSVEHVLDMDVFYENFNYVTGDKGVDPGVQDLSK